METHLLEINLISAQRLKPSSSNLRRLQTYAIIWVDPNAKLRTRIDKLGGENPTWNDKFFFRVTPDFLSRETSAVSVQIHAVGYLKDPLIGTVRLLLSNCLSTSASVRTPRFTAVQVRRPSGRFQGALNIGAMIVNGSEFASLTELSAFGYRDIMRECEKSWRNGERRTAEEYPGENSSVELSDGGVSSTSSASTPSRVLKDWNGVREEKENEKGMRSDGAGYLCGLLLQRRIYLCPSDLNFNMINVSDEKKT